MSSITYSLTTTNEAIEAGEPLSPDYGIGLPEDHFENSPTSDLLAEDKALQQIAEPLVHAESNLGL